MLKRKFKAASKLSPADWGLLMRAWFWLLIFDLGLRALPFTRMQQMATGALQERPGGKASQPEFIISRNWRFVDIASRHHIYKMSCLRRSLVLQRLLYRQGLQADLRFGVNKAGGELQAHAWLEFQGRPIGEPETLSEHFTTLLIKKRSMPG